MSIILQTNNLSKSYKHKSVLNNINLYLESGKIYGLIGLNGAGKTTLMKLIAGFLKPTSGSISLFGQSSEKGLIESRKRIGCLIETPSISLNMTAEENIRLHSMIKGIPSDDKISMELLASVGLKDLNNMKVKNFSLGMKQKLAIAISLIGNPELLILDEPTNGLDPKAIVEMREMLKRFCLDRNITIFISSHILSELYMLASDYVILDKGEIKEETTHQELNEKCKKHILLRCDEPEKMAYVIENSLNTRNYVVMPDKSIKLYDYIDDLRRVAKVFMDEKIIVTNLSCEGDSLEDYFINSIGGRNV